MDGDARGDTSAGDGNPWDRADPEWPARAADVVEELVGAVHTRVVRPLVLVARGIVFGLIITAMALVAGILISVALIRILDVYAFGGRVWASDALVGALLCAAGGLAWSRRSPRGPGTGEKWA